MKTPCRTLIAGAMAAVVVCAPAAGEAPEAQEQEPQHTLRVGLTWAIEPVDIHDRRLRYRESPRMVWDSQGGVLRVRPGEGTDVVEIEFLYPVLEWNEPEGRRVVVTQPHIFLHEGEVTYSNFVVSNRHFGESVGIDSWTYTIAGGVHSIEKIGVATMTRAGQSLANQHRRDRTERMMEEAGVRVLPPPISGEPFGDFEIDTLDHGVIRSEDFRGSVVLIHVWRSQNQILPHRAATLREWARRHTLEGLVIIGVNGDECPDVARASIAEHGMYWPQIHAHSITGPEHRRLWMDVSEHNGTDYHTLIRRTGLVYAHGGWLPPDFLVETALMEGSWLQRTRRNRPDAGQCTPPAAK